MSTVNRSQFLFRFRFRHEIELLMLLSLGLGALKALREKWNLFACEPQLSCQSKVGVKSLGVDF